MIGVGRQHFPFPEIFLHHALLLVELPVGTDGTDLDADPAGIRPPAGEFFCHFQARRFVVVPWNTVITDPQGLFGATLHAGLAFDAQFFLHQGVGRQGGGGENRNETNPGSELRRQEAVVPADGSQTRVFGRQDMTEGGSVPTTQVLKAAVTVTAEESCDMTKAIQMAGDIIS